jgi:hypothetical protein
MSERTFQCRRNKACRAWLPESAIDWQIESGIRRPFCQPGMCPNNKRSDTSDELLALQLELRRVKETARTAERDRDRALAELANTIDSLATALDIREIEQPEPLSDQHHGPRSESVPILLCSDWHCGAVVRAESVNNLNSYDVDEFHRRSGALFVNALKVIRMVRSSCDVQQMVLWLGGDLIDNWLHPEQAQTQELSPTQQIIECERAIVAGIDHLLEHGGFDRIVIPCSYGNHGRTTPKMQADNAHATSYEWLMYQSLRRHYRHEPRIEWHISDGNILYVEVLGRLLRFHHGDAIRYQGGIGGLTIPLTKWQLRQDQGIRADHSFFGHFHQLTMGTGWSVNGSLIGPTAYGLKLGFAPERPQQLLRFLDSERGWTGAFPILTD